MKEGDYIYGEVIHLLEGGVHPEQICATLNRTAGSIAKLAARRGDNKTSNIFTAIKNNNKEKN